MNTKPADSPAISSTQLASDDSLESDATSEAQTPELVIDNSTPGSDTGLGSPQQTTGNVEGSSQTPSQTMPATPIETAKPTQTLEPTTTPSTTPIPTIAPDVAAYLEEAYTIMFENSVRRDVINWERFRQRYDGRIRAVQPKAIEEVHGILSQAVGWLGDQHSIFFTADEISTWTTDEHEIDPSRFDGAILEDSYGYISVPTFSSGSDSVNNDFATAMQLVIAEIDRQQPCGWIVDLRYNHGGNMWPMTAGIGPILGEGEFGANIRPDDRNIIWRYENGQAWWGDELLAETNTEPVKLHVDLPPTAVLISRNTGSAGEAVAIAFKGRPQTRFFGQATAGLTTANEPYFLSDGSAFFLSDSYMGDRNGRAFKAAVAPSEEVFLGDSLDIPIAWLASQSACNK